MQRNLSRPGFRFFYQTSFFIFFVFIFQAVYLLSAFSKEKNRITRGEFINVMAKHQPGNPFFPKNPAALSEDELYVQTVQSLKLHGFNILEGKEFQSELKTAILKF